MGGVSGDKLGFGVDAEAVVRAVETHIRETLSIHVGSVLPIHHDALMQKIMQVKRQELLAAGMLDVKVEQMPDDPLSILVCFRLPEPPQVHFVAQRLEGMSDDAWAQYVEEFKKEWGRMQGG